MSSAGNLVDVHHDGIKTAIIIAETILTYIHQETKEQQSQKYIVDGVLQSPDNRNPKVRTVWFIKKDNLPKFVTAYPIKK